MLNIIEMSDMWQFQASLPEGREKDLLHRVLFDYNEYTKCGTPEDCKDRLEWMKMSHEDIRKNFNTILKGLREEVEYVRETAYREAERKYNPTPKKRGRPKKPRRNANDTHRCRRVLSAVSRFYPGCNRTQTGIFNRSGRGCCDRHYH